MLNMFAKCGSPARAREIFNDMITRENSSYDVVLWNELIISYVDNGCFQEAMQSFWMMLLEAAASPNSVTFSRVLAACEEEPCRAMVKSLAMESGWESDSQVSNALVAMLARSGFAEQALERVILLKLNSVVAWTSTITGLVDKGLHEEALKFLPVMMELRLLRCSLPVPQLSTRTKARRFTRKCWKVAWNRAGSLVAMYAWCGNLVTAYKMFTSIEDEHRLEDHRKVLVVS